MARKYESGSAGPGTIANNSGDVGGASYGTYQIATNTGTMSSFLKYLKGASPQMFGALAGKTPGGAAFNNAWKSLANANPSAFNAVQHNFIKQSHFDPAANKVYQATGLNVNKRSPAVQNVLWSVATQHGAGGASRIFKNALGSKGSAMSDAAIINAIYKERMAGNGMKYFPSSSANIRNSVVNRFRNEWQDALNMLRG